MILTAFHLRRDRHTEKDSFGYTRPVMSKIRQMPAYSPTLGCPIECPVNVSITIKTRIVKMVEFYNRDNGAFVVERLSWMFDTLLYPYKARYINLKQKDTVGDVDILFLENMSKIHKTLSGNYVSFSSPIQYHINSAAQPWHSHHSHGELTYLGNKYRDWMSSFAYAHDNWNDTEKFVDMFDNGPLPLEAENHFKQFILPRPPIRDPFTINNSGKPIPAQNLIFEVPLCRPFDTSQPNELIISHPEKTLFSPPIDQQTIDTLDQMALQYSDLSFEYILSGTAFVNCKINHLVSRYRSSIVSYADADRECRWVVNSALNVLYYANNSNIKFLGDVRATITTTYGEEALVEFFEYDTNQYLGAIHFDLAMLALCALSMAVCVEPF